MWLPQGAFVHSRINELKTKVMNQEIKELGIVELFEKVLNISIEESIAMGWEEENKLVMGWAKEHNYYVYSEPRESFFRWEGIKLAKEGGYNGVIFENLS